MRILLTGIAALILAGCHASAPDAANTAAADEAAVESGFENRQAALAASIENDVNADDAEDADTGAGTDAPAAYACDNGMTVTVDYSGADGKARLTTGGRTFTMPGFPVGKDIKYHVSEGLTPDKSLTWWTKDDGALLIQAPRGARDGKDETTVKCLITDQDQ
jgi:membrane-bound inhibitor of C-type lysozyme